MTEVQNITEFVLTINRLRRNHMIQLSRNYSLPEREEQIIPIKVIAVGSAGSNALDRVVLDGMDKSDLIAANTDVAIARQLRSAAVKVQLGRSDYARPWHWRRSRARFRCRPRIRR